MTPGAWQGPAKWCGPICRRLAQEPLEDLNVALRASRQGAPHESLNAISRRTKIRKTDLIKHRDECLGMGVAKVGPVPGPVGEPASDGAGPARTGAVEVVEGEPSHTMLLTTRAREPNERKEYQQVPNSGPVHHSVVAEHSLVPAINSLESIQSLAAQRAHHIASLMVGPHWKRKVIHELATQWGVSADSVRGYARAAAAILSADRGQLDQQREVSVAYVTRRRDVARAQVTRQTKIADELSETAEDEALDAEVRMGALKSETFARKNAVDAGKLEQKWQEHLDRIAGVMTNGAPMNVQVNNYNSERFQGTMGVVLAVLEKYPEARAEVMDAVRAQLAQKAKQ